MDPAAKLSLGYAPNDFTLGTGAGVDPRIGRIVQAGCVEFEVDSQAIPNLSVDGYVPCDGPEDCPTGQTCDLAIGLCG